MTSPCSRLTLSIACGGTGGHLFPGIAVGRELLAEGCRVLLLVSPKEIDQTAIAGLSEFTVATLPAVGLQNRNYTAFLFAFLKAWRVSRRLFKTPALRPDALLAMGGFTAAPPFLAARQSGALTFLHESNSIPGRANRFLTRWARRSFTGFAETNRLLRPSHCLCLGTPVRDSIARLRVHHDAAAARTALGLHPLHPVLLITGGSQGARGLNRLVLAALTEIARSEPPWQFIHLAGRADLEEVRAAYAPLGNRALVLPFLSEMNLALEAAEVVISRSGASSMAELAALRLPSILVPLPSSQDNHQFHNARSFERAGAALRLDQSQSTSNDLVQALRSLQSPTPARISMREALARLDTPTAAADVAASILQHLREPFTQTFQSNSPTVRLQARVPRSIRSEFLGLFTSKV